MLILTLTDPSTRNAVGGQLSEELEGEVDRFGQGPALRVLVLTGADPAFCSGANVRGFNRAVQQREAQGPPPPPTPWERLDPAYMAESLHEPQGPTYAMSMIKMLVHKAQNQDLAEHLMQASRAQSLARAPARATRVPLQQRLTASRRASPVMRNYFISPESRVIRRLSAMNPIELHRSKQTRHPAS